MGANVAQIHLFRFWKCPDPDVAAHKSQHKLTHQLLTASEWVLCLPAASRQKMHGLLQLLPLDLLILPSMPRFPEKAEGLCSLGLRGLSVAMQLPVDSIPRITQCSQVLKAAGLGPFQ